MELIKKSINHKNDGPHFILTRHLNSLTLLTGKNDFLLVKQVGILGMSIKPITNLVKQYIMFAEYFSVNNT